MIERSKRLADPRKPVTTKIASNILDSLKAAAVENNRTLGAEIEFRLLASLGSDQRTIIREEVRAAMDEHEANLAVARVRRSAALEELAQNDAVDLSGGHPMIFRFADGTAPQIHWDAGLGRWVNEPSV